MKELIPQSRQPLVLEKKLIEAGYSTIVGIDEVGRGCIAGPVVAAAVILDIQNCSIADQIRDSKKLSPEKREKLFKIIEQEAISIGIGFVPHDVIDRINILQATFEAMKIALSKLSCTPNFCLVDGNQKIPTPLPQLCIPKGDDLITSIGAASIIAKVTRDRWMKDVAAVQYPNYLFEKNKGYGTADHVSAIKIHGFSEIHRRSFAVNLD